MAHKLKALRVNNLRLDFYVRPLNPPAPMLQATISV